MKKIYIILMHTKTIPARVIKIATKYRYSHVGISLDKSCDKIYSFGRKTLHSIMNSGFCIEYKNGKFFEYFDQTDCKIYEIEITEEQYYNLKNLLEEIEGESDNYKYDYFGLIARYFGIPVTWKNRFVCSYFIAYLLEKSKIYTFEKDVSMICPKDFANLKGLKEIYCGKYKLYK